MGLRKFKPTTPGTRHAVLPDFAEVTRSRPEKRLLEPLRSSGGRNNHGHTTARFRGGGHKRMYRRIDFHRNKDGVPGKVVSIEYDPNRSARIALVQYADGEKRYILAPRGLTVGQRIENGPGSEPAVGNAMPLASIPVGLAVHNVEMVPGRGGQLAKSAGSQITLAGREGKHAILILPSGEMRRVPVQCRATIGQVGNIDHNLVKLGKAGRRRWHGRRPHNRGVAMNPVAHPMGGGEGRSGGGRHPCSPTGKLAKGGKTRNPRKTAQKFVIRRRSKKKK